MYRVELLLTAMDLSLQANRQSRQQFDLKLKAKQQRHTSVKLPQSEFTYGRALRP